MTDTERLHYVRVCEKLATETRRADSAEAELRETSGELENLRANFKALDLDEPMAAQTRLTEATALLARIVKYAREDRATTRGVTRLARALAEAERLLSRAPAQPAAPQADGSRDALLCYEGDCAKMTGRARPCPIHDAQPAAPYTGASAYADMVQPAAPAPDITDPPTCPKCKARKPTNSSHYEICESCGFKPADYREPTMPERIAAAPLDDQALWPFSVPRAAPEPSAENDWLELIRLREFVKGTSSTAPMVHFMLRAEAAVAQLAAVRKLLNDRDISPGRRIMQALSLLTSAPSPGAGEETE